MDAACTVDGCPNPPRRRGYCWSHLKQIQRRGEVGELQEPKGAARDRAGMPRRSRVEQVIDAALDLADANSEGEATEYERARHRLLVAADRKAPRPETTLGPPRPRGRPRGGSSRMTLWRRRKGV